MTKIGSQHVGPTLTTIRSGGFQVFGNDGWTVVDTFPNSKLPNGHNRNGVFIVTGQVWIPPYTPKSITDWHVDIALTTEKGTTLGFRESHTRIEFRSPALGGNAIGSRPRWGLPFVMILPFTSTRWGKYNPAGNDRLQLRARMWYGPNSLSTKLDGVFQIDSPRFLWFDVEAMNASHWTLYYEGQDRTFPALRAPGGVSIGSLSLPAGDADNWLCFLHCRYSARAQVHRSSLIQYDGGQAGYDSYALSNLLGGAVDAKSSYESIHSMGLFKVIRNEPSSRTIGFVGNTESGASTTPETVRTYTQHATYFAMKLNEFARHAFVEQNGTNTFAYFRSANATPTNVPFEANLQDVLGDVAILFQPGLSMSSGGEFREPYRLAAETNKSRSLLAPNQYSYAEKTAFTASPNAVEGPPMIATMEIAANWNPLEEPQVRVQAIAAARTPAATWTPRDARFVAWVWEGDLNKLKRASKPPPPPTVVLPVGREGPELSALSALPYEPERSHREDVDDGASPHTLKPLTGDIITWPSTSVPRALWDVQFVLSETEKGNLIGFLEAERDRVFKWTPKELGGQPIAFKLAGPVKQTQLSNASVPNETETGYWRISFKMLELLWIGVT